jgi:hypothetical protein
MKRALLISGLLVGLLVPAQANAHLVAKPKCKTMECRKASQLKNIKHARYVCAEGRRVHKRWSCSAVQWLKREYNETLAALAPKWVASSSSGYQGLTRIRYANPYCESGGDPYNKHNSKYRGKWQFDQGTWDAHAPAGWRGHDPATVPEHIQDQAALAVGYDAWPNC